jgi:hypothetical protein
MELVVALHTGEQHPGDVEGEHDRHGAGEERDDGQDGSPSSARSGDTRGGRVGEGGLGASN